jgi:hypothetical protein
MLNWTHVGKDVYCNDALQFTCFGYSETTAAGKAAHYVRILAALEAMHTLTRDATDNRNELVP